MKSYTLKKSDLDVKKWNFLDFGEWINKKYQTNLMRFLWKIFIMYLCYTEKSNKIIHIASTKHNDKYSGDKYFILKLLVQSSNSKSSS